MSELRKHEVDALGLTGGKIPYDREKCLETNFFHIPIIDRKVQKQLF